MNSTNTPLLTISKAAKTLGITPKTLRRWEGYGLINPIRGQHQIRLYEPDSLRQLINRKHQPLPKSTDASTSYLTPKDVSKILHVSIKTLRRWEKLGKISCHRNHLNQRVFYKEEVAQLKYSQSHQPQFISPPISQFFQPAHSFYLLFLLYLPLIGILARFHPDKLKDFNLPLNNLIYPSLSIEKTENGPFRMAHLNSAGSISIQNPQAIPLPVSPTLPATPLSATTIGLNNPSLKLIDPHILPDNLHITQVQSPHIPSDSNLNSELTSPNQ